MSTASTSGISLTDEYKRTSARSLPSTGSSASISSLAAAMALTDRGASLWSRRYVAASVLMMSRKA